MKVYGVFTALLCISFSSVNAFSTQMLMKANNNEVSRRDAFVRSASSFLAVGAGFGATSPAFAASAPKIVTLENGIKYAITKPATTSTVPQQGDIVAVDYTGYLTSGQIFDATHSEGKSNALLFQLGKGAVIPGLDAMVANMQVGEKVQAIIPPSLAYGEKGVCLEDGECLIKPGTTLVYDILLKRSSIPPP